MFSSFILKGPLHLLYPCRGISFFNSTARSSFNLIHSSFSPVSNAFVLTRKRNSIFYVSHFPAACDVIATFAENSRNCFYHLMAILIPEIIVADNYLLQCYLPLQMTCLLVMLWNVGVDQWIKWKKKGSVYIGRLSANDVLDKAVARKSLKVLNYCFHGFERLGSNWGTYSTLKSF